LSTAKQTAEPPEPDRELRPPFFGALLRITWQHVRSQMHEAIHAAGFTDFQDAHFAVFSYPLPDGVRPSELARQKRMSRQAINYLLIQLEELGYVERRAPEGSDRRLIYLSARGRQLAETIFTCLRRLHAEWAEEIGEERFNDFLDVLKQLSARAQQDRSKDPG
jgi:DNA-binding MarR family transcriptional regulator